MPDKIAEWIEKLATGKKARAFWAIVIAILIIFGIAFPFIDANFFFYHRVETRIDNLEKLVTISGVTVAEEPTLYAEFQDILQDMENARENSVFNLSFDGLVRTDTKIKFWSGCMIGIILMLAGLFEKKPTGIGRFRYFITNRIPVIFIGGLIGLVFGYLFTYIPTLGSPWVNAIIGPVLQFMFLDLLLSTPKKRAD